MGDIHLGCLAVAVEHFHAAIIGQAWHSKMDNAGDSSGVIEGGGKYNAGFGKEGEAALRIFGFGARLTLALKEEALRHFALDTLGDVTNVAGEAGQAANLDAGDGQLDGEFDAIGALAGKLDTIADEMRLASGEVAHESGAVAIAQGQRNDAVGERLADHIRASIAEHAFSGGVKIYDATVAIHRDDGIVGSFEDSSFAGFALTDGVLGALALDELANLIAQ